MRTPCSTPPRHREELVWRRRDRQQREWEYLRQVVLAAAEIGELLDQAEKGEQREKAEQDEADRGVDLPRQVALERAAECASHRLPAYPQTDQLHALREHEQQQQHHAGVHQPPADAEVEPTLRDSRLAHAEE